MEAMRLPPLLLLLLLGTPAGPATTLRYWIEPCAQPQSECRPGDPELAGWALAAWQNASQGHLTLEKTAERELAHIRIHWATGTNGQYGETRPIEVLGARGAEVYVLPTVVAATVEDRLLRDAVVYLTCLHETGHALGLEHTAVFADIMYSFQYGGDITEYFARYRREIHTRSGIRAHSGISPADRRRLLELYR
jgi:hypothetical protein